MSDAGRNLDSDLCRDSIIPAYVLGICFIISLCTFNFARHSWKRVEEGTWNWCQYLLVVENRISTEIFPLLFLLYVKPFKISVWFWCWEGGGRKDKLVIWRLLCYIYDIHYTLVRILISKNHRHTYIICIPVLCVGMYLRQYKASTKCTFFAKSLCRLF